MEDRYTFRPSGGESWQDMESRVRMALRHIAQKTYNSVALVTHAGTIRVILNLLNVKSRAETISFIPSLGKCIVVDFDPSVLFEDKPPEPPKQ